MTRGGWASIYHSALNSAFGLPQRFKTTSSRRPVQRAIEAGERHRGAECRLERIDRREVERGKGPESMLLAQITSFSNQDLINKQPMQSHPIPVEFLFAFLQLGSSYLPLRPFLSSAERVSA